MNIKVTEIIGSDSATIRDQGLAIYELAKECLSDNKDVEISFEGVDIVISSFLNASIGKLYGDFTIEEIESKITVIGLDEDDMELLELTVIPNAKEYYADQKKIEEIEKSILSHKE